MTAGTSRPLAAAGQRSRATASGALIGDELSPRLLPRAGRGPVWWPAVPVGRHERLHWTLKQDTAMPPKASLRAQQAAFDRFQDEYNHERPHAALAKRTPAELYQPSPRSYPARVREPEYPAHFSVRRVCGSGEIKWHGEFIYLAQLLAGEPVGLNPIDDRHWRIYFGAVPLAILDSHTKRLGEIPTQPLIRERL